MNTKKTLDYPLTQSIDVMIKLDLRLNNQSVNFVVENGKLYISLLSLMDIYNQSVYYSLASFKTLLGYLETSECIKVHDDIFLPDYSLIWLFNQLDNVDMSNVIFRVIQKLKSDYRKKPLSVFSEAFN